MRCPDRRVGLLLVDHGSRSAASNAQLETLADLIRARRPELVVGTAHMEIVQPDMLAGITALVELGVERIVVHPYFLAPGRHSQEDTPRLVEEARTEHPNVRIDVTEALGLDDRLVELVLDRAAPWLPE